MDCRNPISNRRKSRNWGLRPFSGSRVDGFRLGSALTGHGSPGSLDLQLSQNCRVLSQFSLSVFLLPDLWVSLPLSHSQSLGRKRKNKNRWRRKKKLSELRGASFRNGEISLGYIYKLVLSVIHLIINIIFLIMLLHR
jgi:hypothetical protein